MTLQEMLVGMPEARKDLKSRADIRLQLRESKSKLVVIDDDPTGTQTTHDIRAYLDWSYETMARALTRERAVFYVSTNSRALSCQNMRKISLDVGRSLKAANRQGLRVLIASRSDSTLRGHYPAEVDAILEGLDFRADGVIIAPSLFEAGRYTIDDIHWVEQDGQMVMAAETEFACDPAFGYTKSNLKEWVEEKSAGRWKASGVLSLSLEIIRRQGVEGALAVLMEARNGVPIVLNAACYEDTETAVLAVIEAEKRGKNFAYRCAASFVKVRGGFVDKPLLTTEELRVQGGPGLVVLELQVSRLAETAVADQQETARIARLAEGALLAGKTVVVYTSRVVRTSKGIDFLKFGKRIMKVLCDVIELVQTRPAFVVAKGGITSIEIARIGMSVKEAYVPGQIAMGVPLWELGPEAKWPGMRYVVFPGNVGNDGTLAEVVEALQKGREDKE
jgi:uncharacterized protein YgbK (DUF1537 family)